MAQRPLRYRPSHHPEREAGKRQTARQRGYTTEWQRRRKAWLKEQWEAITDHAILAHLPNCLPPCVDCLSEGKVTEGNEVDHEIPHRGDEALFWDESNWRARCKSHHSAKTRRGE